MCGEHVIFSQAIAWYLGRQSNLVTATLDSLVYIFHHSLCKTNLTRSLYIHVSKYQLQPALRLQSVAAIATRRYVEILTTLWNITELSLMRCTHCIAPRCTTRAIDIATEVLGREVVLFGIIVMVSFQSSHAMRCIRRPPLTLQSSRCRVLFSHVVTSVCSL